MEMRRWVEGVVSGPAGFLAAVTLAALLLVPAPAVARGDPAAGPQAAPGAAAARAPAGGQGTEAVPEVRITPAMVRYSRTRYALYFGGAFLNLLVLYLLLRSGFSARLRDLAERRARSGLARAFIDYPLFTVAHGALTLPLVFYSGYLLPRQYGLSTQTPLDWALDGLKALAVTVVVGAPIVAFLYWMIRRHPRRWWVGFWIFSIPLLTLGILLAPLVFDPLFNRFQPLRDERLRAKILSLAARAGIERGRVFEMDASRRTKKTNAYVTGLGGSARIVLWDTLLREMDEDEILFVMAHEMGHYVEGHVPVLLGVSILGSFVLLWATDRGARLLIARNGGAWKVRDPGDLASFPVLLLVLSLLQFFGSPVEAAISRTVERRADTFALRLTGDGRAAARAFVELSEGNLSHPDPPPFVEFWFFSHPPLRDRIEGALAWEGQSTDMEGLTGPPAGS